MDYYNQGYNNVNTMNGQAVPAGGFSGHSEMPWDPYGPEVKDEMMEMLRRKQEEVRAQRDAQQQADQLDHSMEDSPGSLNSGSNSAPGIGGNYTLDMPGGAGGQNDPNLMMNLGGEDEETMMKRKAQNRAAQKAFRERREQRIKALEESAVSLKDENVDLKRQIEELQKENVVLKSEKVVLQTLVQSAEEKAKQGGSNDFALSVPSKVSFPPTKFFSTLNGGHALPEGVSGTVQYTKDNGQKMMGVGAVWEMLSADKSITDWDIQYVLDSLKGKAICDGFGPAYAFSDVVALIERAKAFRRSEKASGISTGM